MGGKSVKIRNPAQGDRPNRDGKGLVPQIYDGRLGGKAGRQVTPPPPKPTRRIGHPADQPVRCLAA